MGQCKPVPQITGIAGSRCGQGAASWAVDELGPATVAFLRPCSGVEAVVVIDNVALGPAIGGVRIRPGITAGEVARLARAMTEKNALAGLPHGGAKAGIAAPPDLAVTAASAVPIKLLRIRAACIPM